MISGFWVWILETLIENFKLLSEFYYDSTKKVYMLVGLVGDSIDQSYKDLNRI